MESFDLSWRVVLIAAIVLLSAYVVLVVVALARNRGWFRKRHRPTGDAGHFAVAPLRDEIRELRRQIAELRSEVDALRTVAPKENQTPYASAIQLAKGGQEPLAIAEHCGISRGEAELIAALYRKR